MKIIEGLKELRLLEKKIQQNQGRITAYASAVSTEKLPYEDEDRQSAKVQSLIQSTMDMVERYLRLKAALDRTNLQVVVTIEGQTRTIHEWIWLRRKLGMEVVQTYNALNDSAGSARLREAPTIEGERPQVLRFYTEEDKLAAIDKWQDIIHGIDPRMEVVNATTDIIGYDEEGEDDADAS